LHLLVDSAPHLLYFTFLSGLYYDKIEKMINFVS
jgi:hypothetical protein